MQVGTVIDNGGTATIAAGDNVTDHTVGNTGTGFTYVGDSGGNGWVNMSGGTLSGYSGQYPQEFLGFGGAGSGVFTQSGGINSPWLTASQAGGTYSSLQLGNSQGGYGEYNLSGGR